MWRSGYLPTATRFLLSIASPKLHRAVLICARRVRETFRSIDPGLLTSVEGTLVGDSGSDTVLLGL